MSDPVTNAEVEDVLSSIRRLVSEDKRPLQAQKAMPENDRLVLTPALRVAEVPDDDDHSSSDQDEIAPDHAAPSEQDDEALFDDPAHDYDADPYNFADVDDEDGEGDEALNLAGLEINDADDDSHDEIEDEAVAAELSSDDAGDTDVAKSATLSAKIEALETAIGKISDTWEPDAPGADDYSGTEAPAMAWEDDVDRDAMGARVENDEDQVDEPTPASAEKRDAATAAADPEVTSDRSTRHDTPGADGFAFASEDQLIDEEALRDLVSDIVRSELQGALGERITRNVRKLVRREIHRALTTQDLE